MLDGPLRFHWCSPLDSGQTKATAKYESGRLDYEGIASFAREADELDVDSLLMGISYHMPDPLPLIGALTRETKRLSMILAYRPGLLPPTLFVQIANTISWMSDGRLALNLVAGISPVEQAYYGDFLAHDDRYARSNEFLEILHRFWTTERPLTHRGDHYRVENAVLGLPYKGGVRPRIYISGASHAARDTAVRHGDCWLRYGDTPENLAATVAAVRRQGCHVGIRMHVLARESRSEALAALEELMLDPDEEHRRMISDFVATSDSEAVKASFRLADRARDDWVSPMLYSGAVAYRGGPALCVVGSFDEVADYLHQYKSVGVSEFILSGWPTRTEMRLFFRHVVPRVRGLEAKAAGPPGAQRAR